MEQNHAHTYVDCSSARIAPLPPCTMQTRKDETAVVKLKCDLANSTLHMPTHLVEAEVVVDRFCSSLLMSLLSLVSIKGVCAC